jgi:hypothetical protein
MNFRSYSRTLKNLITTKTLDIADRPSEITNRSLTPWEGSGEASDGGERRGKILENLT